MSARRSTSGLSFARVAMSIANAGGSLRDASVMHDARHREFPEVSAYLKAAVAAGSTSDATWAGPLAAYASIANEFVDLVRGASIIGRLAGARRVPFLATVPREDASAGFGWVQEGRAIRVSTLAFGAVQLKPKKAATIVVVSEELLREGVVGAEDGIRRSLVRSVSAGLDASFIDPSMQAGSGPASITYGLTPIPSSGTTVNGISADLDAAMTALADNGIEFAAPFWIMGPKTAIKLSLLRNADGSLGFPSITVAGGTLAGVPVVVSSNAPATRSGESIVLVDADQVLIADDGELQFSASDRTTLQMQDDPAAGATTSVSLFQTSATALRVTRTINWTLARPGAAAIIEGIAL